MAGKPNARALLVAVVAVLFSAIALVPVAVDRLQPNTAFLSRDLQAWRARGQYYVHTKYDLSSYNADYPAWLQIRLHALSVWHASRTY